MLLTLRIANPRLRLQMTAGLRNLAANVDVRKVFVTSRVIELLCLLLPLYHNDVELMLNISRIFSRLTLHTNCRNTLSMVPHAIEHIVQLIVTHKTNQPLAVRLFFTLGNLTASDDDNRKELFHVSNGCELLLELFEDYINCDTQLIETAGKGNTIIKANIRATEDTLIKVGRRASVYCTSCPYAWKPFFVLVRSAPSSGLASCLGLHHSFGSSMREIVLVLRQRPCLVARSFVS